MTAWIPVTTRFRLGMLTANLSWRSPVTVATTSRPSVDVLSGGRIDLGAAFGRSLANEPGGLGLSTVDRWSAR